MHLVIISTPNIYINFQFLHLTHLSASKSILKVYLWKESDKEMSNFIQCPLRIREITTDIFFYYHHYNYE